MAHITDLPVEVICHIYQWLELADVFRAAATCKALRIPARWRKKQATKIIFKYFIEYCKPFGYRIYSYHNILEIGIEKDIVRLGVSYIKPDRKYDVWINLLYYAARFGRIPLAKYILDNNVCNVRFKMDEWRKHDIARESIKSRDLDFITYIIESLYDEPDRKNIYKELQGYFKLYQI